MTPAELKTAVLKELRIVAAGEDAQPEDVAVVTEKYTGLYNMLLAEGLVAWELAADVPTYAEQPLIAMLAYLCGTSFGVNPARMQQLELMGALNLPLQRGGPSVAEKQLRRQLAVKPVPYPAQSDYF